MVATIDPTDALTVDLTSQSALLRGDILLDTRSHSAWGGAVTAQMFLPTERDRVWQQVTDYSRWVLFFPDIIHSEVLTSSNLNAHSYKRLYQIASKAFFIFSAQVEIYLRALETNHQTCQQIQFNLERGTFTDFAANLKLHDLKTGTLLTYSVAATPTIPVPTQLIQQAMKLDLPANMRKMRQVICG